MTESHYKMAHVLELVLDGHNVIITGQCRTGKTYLMRSLINKLSEESHMKVAVTATTGMASLQLGHGATTLHHWSGILDGRYDSHRLIQLYDNDDRFNSAVSRIKNTDCLIIDEISMLSKKTLDLVEFVCRHVRKSTLLFGGIQVIACGDFKQLAPVPNYRMQDDGSYCLESNIFKQTFTHHINLTKVIRQDEPDLVKAIQELCDGNPSEETVQLLRTLDRPLPDSAEVTRLYGTNFDVHFMNLDMLGEMEGDEFMFKAKDEGNTSLLLQVNAAKTLVLKVVAPVILTRNLTEGLFNGVKGVVHSLKKDSSPVINFNGKLITLDKYVFEIYDKEKNTVLATRTQYPLLLAFALTVHRAQGQTLQYVDVDCFSFFAPGQLGVAVGRVKCKAGLRVRNFNIHAATLKHPICVSEFYENLDNKINVPLQDFSCCRKGSHIVIESHLSSVDDTENVVDTDIGCASSTAHCSCGSSMSFAATDIELPQLQCPWDIQDFISENADSYVFSTFKAAFFQSPEFHDHVNFLYFKVNELTKYPFSKKAPQLWNQASADLNTFLTGTDHIGSCEKLFSTRKLTKQQNKLSTKLMFWLYDKIVDMKATDIKTSKIESIQSTGSSEFVYSSAGESKIRYIAGACINKITKRLKNSVIRKMSQTSKKSKLACKLDYKKQAMLKIFRIREDEAPEDSSMAEIYYKQGVSKGLTIVNDNLFSFFLELNAFVQKNLSKEYFHLYGDDTFNFCRNNGDSNIDLITKWITLFGSIDDDVEDEIFLTLVMDLFQDITEHFIRIAFVDGLKIFKASIPRKKKQALRTKITALGDRSVKKIKNEEIEQQEACNYLCNICKMNCDWEPASIDLESIACDKCNCWYHYGCVNLTGTESFLSKSSSKWFCPNCSKKGKGKGKGRGKKTHSKS